MLVWLMSAVVQLVLGVADVSGCISDSRCG